MTPLESTLEQVGELLEALDELATGLPLPASASRVLADRQHPTIERFARLREHVLGGETCRTPVDDLLLRRPLLQRTGARP